jgi:superfamily II DNA or RNA helicase
MTTMAAEQIVAFGDALVEAWSQRSIPRQQRILTAVVDWQISDEPPSSLALQGVVRQAGSACGLPYELLDFHQVNMVCRSRLLVGDRIDLDSPTPLDGAETSASDRLNSSSYGPILAAPNRPEADFVLPSPTVPPPLYPWQRDAYEAWVVNGRRGVVEAVTGAGKTRLAQEAIMSHIKAGGRCAVIVPSIVLQDQWCRIFKSYDGIHLQRLDGNHKYNARMACDVLIAVVNTASTYFSRGGFVEEFLDGHDGLVVLDECHRYGAEKFAQALSPTFARRLGLTATYERSDNGLKDHVTPYTGGVVFRIGYRRALREDVICHFKVAFMGVQFSIEERLDYEEQYGKQIKAYQRLRASGEVTLTPMGSFMRDVQRLATSRQKYGPLCNAARTYLACLSRCRQIVAGAGAKGEVIRALRPALEEAQRSILFTDTQDSATSTRETLEDLGLSAGTVDANMSLTERRRVMVEFEEGGIGALTAPKVLDEGVNVPACDLGVVVAASRSRRQMIQRMGRILRRKDDGRQARLVVIFVQGTPEDPARGAHETFLDEVTDAADAVSVFYDAAQALPFLNAWSPSPSGAKGSPPDAAASADAMVAQSSISQPAAQDESLDAEASERHGQSLTRFDSIKGTHSSSSVGDYDGESLFWRRVIDGITDVPEVSLSSVATMSLDAPRGRQEDVFRPDIREAPSSVPNSAQPPIGATVPWRSANQFLGFAVVNMETNGTNANRHRVIELAVVGLKPDLSYEGKWASLIDPGTTDMGRTDIHGIQPIDVMGAPTFADVVGDISALLRGRVLVAHNMDFDVLFLDKEFQRAGLSMHFSGVPGINTLSMAWQRWPVQNATLGECCRWAGIATRVTHTALGDALTIADLFRYLYGYIYSESRQNVSRAADVAAGIPWPDFPFAVKVLAPRNIGA